MLRSSVIERRQSHAACAVTAPLPTLALCAARANALARSGGSSSAGVTRLIPCENQKACNVEADRWPRRAVEPDPEAIDGSADGEDAKAEWEKEEMLMEKQTKLPREAQQRKRSAEPLPAPPSDTPSSVKALMERVALEPHADVEKLERLVAMHERLKARE